MFGRSWIDRLIEPLEGRLGKTFNLVKKAALGLVVIRLSFPLYFIAAFLLLISLFFALAGLQELVFASLVTGLVSLSAAAVITIIGVRLISFK